MSDVINWTEAAEQWIDWVQSENHDAFWAFRSAFERFVGPGPGEAVELGAGEGRISRVLGELGWRMTLVEPVAPLLNAAREANSGVTYHLAPANAAPAPPGAFDLVVIYNVLMDVDDLTGTVAKAAELLSPSGRMIVGIVHPILDTVHVEQERAPKSYFEPHQVDATFERDGLTMRFRGWRRPLSAYVNALSAAGLRLTRMEEPQPDPSHPATDRLDRGKRLPMFLWMELRRAED